MKMAQAKGHDLSEEESAMAAETRAVSLEHFHGGGGRDHGHDSVQAEDAKCEPREPQGKGITTSLFSKWTFGDENEEIRAKERKKERKKTREDLWKNRSFRA